MVKSHTPFTQNANTKEIRNLLAILTNSVFSNAASIKSLSRRLGVSRGAVNAWLYDRQPIPPARLPAFIDALLDQLTPLPAVISELQKHAGAMREPPAVQSKIAKMQKAKKQAREAGRGPLITDL